MPVTRPRGCQRGRDRLAVPAADLQDAALDGQRPQPAFERLTKERFGQVVVCVVRAERVVGGAVDAAAEGIHLRAGRRRGWTPLFQRLAQFPVERLAEAPKRVAVDPVQGKCDRGPVRLAAVGETADRQLQRQLKGRVALRVSSPGPRHQQRRWAAAAPCRVGGLAAEQLFDPFGAVPIVNLQDVAQIRQGRVLQPIADLDPDRRARRTFTVSQHQAHLPIHRGRRPGTDHERKGGARTVRFAGAC